MKRFISLLICIMLVFNLLPLQSFAEDQEIKVYVNGKQVIFDTPPFIEDGTTMVPARAIFETLDLTVNWFTEPFNFITVLKPNSKLSILFDLDKGNARFKGEEITLSKPPRLVNDRTYIPLRFLSEKLLYVVSWDEETQTININNRPTKTSKEILEVKNCILKIETFDKNGNPLKQGSGVQINDSGYVITNYHVLENASSITLYDLTYTQRNDNIQIIEVNKDKDIALIKYPTYSKQQKYYPIIGDSDATQSGDKIYTISNPKNLLQVFSEGLVGSWQTINKQDYIQFTAPVSSGSSGGAVFNVYGDLIGIVTWKYVSNDSEGLAFAIPINDILKEFKEYIK